MGATIGVVAGLVAVNLTFNVASPFLFQGPPSAARSSLAAIVAAVISLTALVFSLTFVVLQLTAGQLSPRVLQVFLGDRVIHLIYGVFVASFVYATVVLQTVKGDSAGDVPRLAVTAAFLFVFASAGVFDARLDGDRRDRPPSPQSAGARLPNRPDAPQGD